MRERPILMSGPLVRAVLEGRKTQTRRTVRLIGAEVIEEQEDGVFWPWSPQHDGWIACPYGHVGDRLWVRETWAPAFGDLSYEYEEHSVFEWDPDKYGPLVKGAPGLEIYYRADGEDALPAEFSMSHGSEIRWRPSIHMPRWASRLSLRITDVRVERLQDISEEDARAEGCEPGEATDGSLSFVLGFGDLWDSIAAKGTTWDANPWVWSISFEREGRS